MVKLELSKTFDFKTSKVVNKVSFIEHYASLHRFGTPVRRTYTVNVSELDEDDVPQYLRDVAQRFRR